SNTTWMAVTFHGTSTRGEPSRSYHRPVPNPTRKATTVGPAASMTRFLLDPSDPAAPGAGRPSGAGVLLAWSRIDPPFRVRAVVDGRVLVGPERPCRAGGRQYPVDRGPARLVVDARPGRDGQGPGGRVVEVGGEVAQPDGVREAQRRGPGAPGIHRRPARVQR